ncbi:hypothetical protein ASNO1_55150 [Corallococcus caeni]|uniref:Uncharacterized protein n=1 Tax=Corallococcus caeni TaxID=3082388 RepID=A0ABQ6QZJ8_9BACT|nr:hypothetical protein ASNO1_55150 [Corallococcus sp. NO1]
MVDATEDSSEALPEPPVPGSAFVTAVRDAPHAVLSRSTPHPNIRIAPMSLVPRQPPAVARNVATYPGARQGHMGAVYAVRRRNLPAWGPGYARPPWRVR